MGLESAPKTEGFVVAEHETQPLAGRVHFGPCRNGALVNAGQARRYLLAIVEPLQPTDHGWAIAGLALDAIRDGFQTACDAPSATAIARALASANAAVRSANRGDPKERENERVLIGASVVVIEGSQITIAQVPPSQVFLTQDRLVYPIPTVALWDEHYPGSDRPPAEPLGALERVQFDIQRAQGSEGDVISVCSSVFGKLLANPPDSPDIDPILAGTTFDRVEEREPFSVLDLGPFRPAGIDPAEAWLTWLRDIAEAYRLPNAHGAACHLAVPAPDEASGVSRVVQRVVSLASEDRPPAKFQADHVRPPVAVVRSATNDHQSPRPSSATTVLTNRMETSPLATSGPVSTVLEPARPYLMGALPGAHGVQRFGGDRPHLPGTWRGHLPRFGARPEQWVNRRVVVLLVALCFVACGVGIRYTQLEARSEQVSAALATVDAHLALAATVQDGAQLTATLDQARDAIDVAADIGARPDQLSSRMVNWGQLEDRALGVHRLDRLVRLGGIPTALGATTDGRVRLVRGPDGVYLAGGGVYRLSSERNQLVEILTVGQLIDGVIVEPIRDASWSRLGLVATDGRTLFLLPPNGRWRAQPLGDHMVMPDAIGGTVLFEDYLITIDERSGAVSVINATTTGSSETTLTPYRIEADRRGIDVVVGDRLYLLQRDGDVYSLRVDGRATDHTVVLDPPVTHPIAIDALPGTSGFVLLDAGPDGLRLIHHSLDHDRTTVILLPRSLTSAPLTVRDFAVDAATGHVYLLTDDAIWVGELPVGSLTSRV